jgi:hypothetical protein
MIGMFLPNVVVSGKFQAYAEFLPFVSVAGTPGMFIQVAWLQFRKPQPPLRPPTT